MTVIDTNNKKCTFCIWMALYYWGGGDLLKDKCKQKCKNCIFDSGEVYGFIVDSKFLHYYEHIPDNEREFKSELAAKFYKQYRTCMEIEHESTREDNSYLVFALFTIIRASWACDDVEDVENANHCREIAISLIPKLIRHGNNNPYALRVIKCDLLCRLDRFQDLSDEFN